MVEDIEGLGSETKAALFSEMKLPLQRKVGVPGSETTQHTRGARVIVFGACVLIAGSVCSLVHSGRSAYRFASVTLAIVLLIPRTNPPWQIAVHRVAEVSIGIGVALQLAMLWPESEDPTSHVLCPVIRPSIRFQCRRLNPQS